MSALAPSSASFKFTAPGVGITGTVARPPEDRQAQEFGTNKPKFWPDGNPVIQTKIVLRTADGEEWAVYAQGKMASAIRGAIGNSGAKDIEVGGTLTVTFTAYGEAKGGGQPPKLYEASYAPPVGGADDDEPPF